MATSPADPGMAEAAPSASKKADPKCPNCGGALVEHGPENPYKTGAWHCDACGICWAPDLSGPRA